MKSEKESTAKNPGDICVATKTAIMSGTTELVPVRFVDENNEEVDFESEKLAAVIFGPNSEGKYFLSIILDMSQTQ